MVRKTTKLCVNREGFCNFNIVEWSLQLEVLSDHNSTSLLNIILTEILSLLYVNRVQNNNKSIVLI